MIQKEKIKKKTRVKKGSFSLPPFHEFNVFDEYFIFETCTMQFYQIDKLTYEFLRLCKKMPFTQARKKFLALHSDNTCAAYSVCNEVSLLATKGLFDVPSNYIDTLNVNKFLASYDFSRPLKGIELNLANCCNFACKYCYCSKYIQNHKDLKLMDVSIAEKAINMLCNKSTSSEINITFFGGEPLLNKKTIDFIMAHAPRESQKTHKKINFIMTTNGSLIDEKIIDYIVNYNFGLMVSMDGDKDLHNALCPTRSGEDSFDLVMEGIKKIKARRNSLAIRATLTTPVPHIKKMIDFFESIGATKIVLGPALCLVDSPSNYAFTKKDFAELARQDKKLLPDIIEKVKRKEIPAYFKYHIGVTAIAMGRLGGRAIRCSAASTNLCIDTNGDIYPCHRFIGMKNWVMGSLQDGVDNQKCRNFWQKYHDCIKANCGNCYAYPLCQGPCPWEIIKTDGSFEFNDTRCEFIKKYMEYSAYVYFQAQSFFEKEALMQVEKILQEQLYE